MTSPPLEFNGDRILIASYPFKPASSKKRLQISATEIEEADVKRCVLLVKGELIYLPGWLKQ